MKGQLIGYGGTNQYKAWIPIRKEVVVSRDVVFDELGTEQQEAVAPIIHDTIVVQKPPEQSELSESELSVHDTEELESVQSRRPSEEPHIRSSTRNNKGQFSYTRYGHSAKLAASRFDHEVKSKTYEEVINDSKYEKE